MQALDINSSHPGSTYGHIGDHGGSGGGQDTDHSPLPHQQLQNQHTSTTGSEYHEQDSNSVPQPPNDNNQVAAWYDTDL